MDCTYLNEGRVTAHDAESCTTHFPRNTLSSGVHFPCPPNLLCVVGGGDDMGRPFPFLLLL